METNEAFFAYLFLNIVAIVITVIVIVHIFQDSSANNTDTKPFISKSQAKKVSATIFKFVIIIIFAAIFVHGLYIIHPWKENPS